MNHEELMIRYITGKATPEEIEKFEMWLNSSEANRALYNDWAGFWEITGKSYNDFEPDVEHRWKEFSELIRQKSNKPKVITLITRYHYRAVACILLFILLGIGGISLFKSGIIPSNKFLTYTSDNDTMSILLEDGSRVSLNAGSTIKIPQSFNKRNRSVYLTGEAFFKVIKDTRHPFKVYAQNTVTEVLGTSFDVKSKEQDVRVTLVTGKVAFYRKNDTNHKLILRPGQHGVFNSSTGFFVKDTVSNQNNIAWKTGKLQFNRIPMAELCRVLSAHYRKKIVFPDADLYEGNFTGIINNISLDEAISIIELTMNVTATNKEDSIIFSYDDKTTSTVENN